MSRSRLSNVIGFDDAPFPPDHVGPVKVVGAIFARLRFDGIVIGEVEKDGFDATDALSRLVSESKFADHVQLLMLQGITFAGFNVVDPQRLHEQLELPVLVISRREPDTVSIQEALVSHVPHGEWKWGIIERMGRMEPVEGVYVQRVGLTLRQAGAVIRRFAIHGHIPEPLRVAHLVAGALAGGMSRGKP